MLIVFDSCSYRWLQLFMITDGDKRWFIIVYKFNTGLFGFSVSCLFQFPLFFERLRFVIDLTFSVLEYYLE